jgi:hypothetical protein
MRRPGHPLRAGFVLGLLAVLVAGCDLFKPATPEVGVAGVALIPSYAVAESCLRYMQVGIERKDVAGQDAYLGALADTTTDGIGFHAFFDEADWRAYTGAEKPADWDLRHEAQFLPVFIRSYGDPYEMKWLQDEVHPYDDDPPDPDHRILHRRYEVRALRQRTADTLLIAVGYADLYFARISASRWALYRWQDRVDPAVEAQQPKDPDQQTFGSRRLNAGAGG